MTRLILTTLLGAIGILDAHNNYFLPGDSFFSTSLTQKDVEALEGKDFKSIKIEYQRLDNRFMACGNLGYDRLELTNVNQSFRKNLLTAYQWVRAREKPVFIKTTEEKKEKFIEWNPVVALIYNKGHVAYPLGLKFNENWKTEGAGQHGGFLDDAWSVVEEWRRADEVAPLKLEKVLDPRHHHANGGVAHRTMKEVLQLKASSAEVVFVGTLQKNSWVHNECPNLKILAEHANFRVGSEKYAYCLRVTSEGVRRILYGEDEGVAEAILNEDGTWTEVKEEE